MRWFASTIYIGDECLDVAIRSDYRCGFYVPSDLKEEFIEARGVIKDAMQAIFNMMQDYRVDPESYSIEDLITITAIKGFNKSMSSGSLKRYRNNGQEPDYPKERPVPRKNNQYQKMKNYKVYR